MANLARINNRSIERNNRNTSINRANVLEDILAIPTNQRFGNVATNNCGMVQNNIVNNVNVRDEDDEDEDPRYQRMEPQEQKQDGLRRFFLAGCAVAIWAGAITVGLCLIGAIILVVMGISRAHIG
jgi:hypothetical protein